MRSGWLIILLLLGFEISTAQTLEYQLSQSKTWHRLLHYKKPWFRKIKGDVTSPNFYLSKNGHKDPYEELIESIKQLKENPKLSCKYPARHHYLYKNIGGIPQRLKCNEFDSWLQSLNAKSIKLGFAGPYRGNPASILGHSFIVIGRGKTELLSYALGFSAQPDPRDSKPIFMWKGITGGYPGMYQLEPYYMRVGVYNNAERRDIWIHDVPLEQNQIDFITYHIWELIQGVQIPYYFVDENCSYRMIELLDLAFEQQDLMAELSNIVLPGDTIKLSIDKNVALPDAQFRSSIQRKLDWTLANMKNKEKNQFQQQLNLSSPSKVNDPEVLEALIMQWNIKAYEAYGQLKPPDAKLRLAYLKQRSKLPTGLLISDENIKEHWDLIPLYYGHPTSWVKLGAGKYDRRNNQNFWEVSYRTGSHAWYLPNKAYEEAANIEYLGFDIRQSEEKDQWDWSFEVIDVLSVNPGTWGFHASVNNVCEICNNRHSNIHLQGGYGLGYNRSQFSAFTYPMLDTRLLYNSSKHSAVGAGLRIGARAAWGQWTLSGDYEHIYHKDIDFENFNLSALYSWNLKQHIQIESQKNESSIHVITHF